MKKRQLIIFVFAIIFTLSISAFSGNEGIINDPNFMALLRNPASPCDGINWEDHCVEKLLPEYTCVIETENATCKFGSMENKD